MPSPSPLPSSSYQYECLVLTVAIFIAASIRSFSFFSSFFLRFSSLERSLELANDVCVNAFSAVAAISLAFATWAGEGAKRVSRSSSDNKPANLQAGSIFQNIPFARQWYRISHLFRFQGRILKIRASQARCLHLLSHPRLILQINLRSEARLFRNSITGNV